MGGPWRTPFPTCCAACSTSAVTLALWSHPFTLSWYFSSFDCSVFLYRLLPLTWHIREAGIYSEVTASGLSKALPSPWHPEQTAATGKNRTTKQNKTVHSTTLRAVSPRLFTDRNGFDGWLDSWRDDQTSKPLTLLWQTTVFCLGFRTIQVTHHRLLRTFDEFKGILDSCDSG